ncbi:MAG: response regulator [Opitutaceae bacterium]|nr:response regulator [Opitutaceae bacterium]
MSSSAAHRRCLIVEDDLVSNRIAARVLEGEGWQVTSARSAEEAVQSTGEIVPDLLLLDLGLPGIDGLTFCRQLRADPRWRDVHIVVCTGRVEPADLAAVLDAGADDYLTKPVSPALLRVRLRIAAARVDRAHLRREFEREASAFKFSAESSQDPVYWIDPARRFRFEWVNDACCRHFMRTRQVMLTLALEDCDPTFGPAEAIQLREQLRANGSYLLETLHLRGDGSVVPVELSANRFLDGNRELVTGYIRDISARKAAEATSARAALLLARLRDAVVCTELDGTVTFWNEGATQLFGWTAGEMLGRPLHQRFPAEAAGESRALLARVAAGEERHGEWLDYRRDGSRVWTDSSLARFLDASGRPAGVLSIARDVSERKRAELERSELERKLQETQKLESLGLLAGGIAHDFNNLLTGILGNASLARLDLPPDSSLDIGLGQIETAALRAAELCQQMLAYSGKAQFVVRALSLARLVDETARLLHLSINKKAHLVLDLAPDLPLIMGDATQLRQVVMNLVLNASEALGPHPGEISVTLRRVAVSRARLSSCHTGADHPGGDSIELTVRDTGGGMNPDTLARIFDPFFTTKFTGRGLGLSAVLGIVRGHHGALDVVSSPGTGTTFTILLPAACSPAAEPGFPAAIAPPWRGSGTVLVADDEEPVREVLSLMLNRLGFEVVAAADGLEALTRFQATPELFVAVLLDLSMPRCDGVETLHAIHALRPGTPVLLISGHGSAEISAQFAHERPAGIVQKPFTSPALREAMQRALALQSSLLPVPSHPIAAPPPTA